MLKISHASLLASLAACCAMLATVAVAEDVSSASATAGQSASAAQSGPVSSSAANQSNLPQASSSTTSQQNKAPVVDPEAAAQDAANAKAGAPINPAPFPANANNQAPSGRSASASPQRYEANRPAATETGNGRGGASLGVNIVTSENGQGVTVAQTRPGTPADQMGIEPNDRIISLNGQPVESVDQFISAIRGMSPGDQVQLSIDRNGNTQNIGGRLEALRDRLANREGAVGNVIGRARDFVRDRTDMAGETRGGRQTNYEENISARPSSDLETRLSRLEQQMDRLMRDVDQLRSSPGSPQPSTSTQPGSTGIGAPGLRDSGAGFQSPTPGTTPATTPSTPTSATPTGSAGSTTTPPTR